VKEIRFPQSIVNPLRTQASAYRDVQETLSIRRRRIQFNNRLQRTVRCAARR
jgi:hypothetical protein